MTTEKERLIAALEQKDIDRPPCICPGGMMNMITTELIEATKVPWPQAHLDPKLMARIAYASYEYECFENVGVPFDMVVEAEALGSQVDLGNIDCEPRVSAYAIDSVKDFERLQPIDFETSRAGVTLKAIRLLKEKNPSVPVVGNITGPVSTASSVAEPVNFYKDMRRNNTQVHRFMQFVTQECIRFALAQVEAGADVICISDPSGTGEILGRKFFDEFTVHYLGKLLEALKPTGVKTIVHICGHMHAVFEEVGKLDCDALSFDAVVPLKTAREALPGRIIIGNVSTFALELNTPEKVAQLTDSCLDNGTAAVAPACGLGMHSPLRNIQQMLITLKERETSSDACACSIE